MVSLMGVACAILTMGAPSLGWMLSVVGLELSVGITVSIDL